ncbi:MAG: hypothetical protein MHM6MM_001449 [Cercozoa sp. M6MM]
MVWMLPKRSINAIRHSADTNSLHHPALLHSANFLLLLFTVTQNRYIKMKLLLVALAGLVAGAAAIERQPVEQALRQVDHLRAINMRQAAMIQELEIQLEELLLDEQDDEVSAFGWGAAARAIAGGGCGGGARAAQEGRNTASPGRGAGRRK